jgi:ubiquitin carboxyl-terminal hydrolase 4/11/15
LTAFSHVADVRIHVEARDTTLNSKYNGNSSLQLHNLVTDQTLILDEAIDHWWVSTYTGQQASRAIKGPAKGNASTLSSKTNSGRNSPAPQGPLTRGRGQRKRLGKSLGAVGLANLGNTCYMNSALQCVRSVEELTKYFLTGSYVEEINKTNPLGYNGRVAMAYVNLLKEIYDEGRGSVTPRDFKTTVGRCRSTFQGWGQQDSQEFLGFLLDGLQEDLSRIKKKPYIEKPDSTDDMINDPEAIRKMAEEVWDITRRRDDSVIADLFTGMYKSTLKCPECGKISITFDPFNNLTLPLPVEDMWVKAVKFFPLNDVPIKIEVELPKHSSIEALKQFMSIRTGVPVERLMGAEEFKDRFFKIYDNQQDVSEEIQSSDIPTIHELEATPTNWPLRRKPKTRSMLDVDTPADPSEWEDPAYEKMVIPVFHRRPNATGRVEGTSPPHFIVLGCEEASNYDIIQRKVLAKVATFSTWQTLRREAEGEGSQSDCTVAIASDADSSGDSKVIAQSVQGEDDIVDVRMKDASEGASVQLDLPHKPGILRQFNTKRPAFLDPDAFLDPELQNLFELSYFFEGSDGPVPTGWSSVDNHRQLPKLADRMPQQSAENDEGSPESWGSTASGNEESSNEDAPQLSKSESTETRMADESSEGDDSGPVRVCVILYW